MVRMVAGRSPYLNGAKGRVSNIKLSPSLLTNTTDIITVELTNMNLEPQADIIASLLPPNVATLSLVNNLFTAVPPGLGNLKKLRSLYVIAADVARSIA